MDYVPSKEIIVVTETNEITEELSQVLGRYGTSEMTYPVSLFSGERSKKADISGRMGRREFKVMMFEPSDEVGVPSVSAHFTSNLNADNLSDDQIAYFNAENRFAKIYRQYDDVYLVMDTFISQKGSSEIVKSITAIWDIAIREVVHLKRSYDRRASLRPSRSA